MCSPHLLHGRFQPVILTDLWCVWRGLTFGHSLSSVGFGWDFFLTLRRKKYFSCEPLFVTTVTKCSSPAQHFVTSLFQEPRCQNSPPQVGCSHLHPISQPSCSPPASTADLVLASHCKQLCGKPTPGGNHIFLLPINGIWQLKMRRSS